MGCSLIVRHPRLVLDLHGIPERSLLRMHTIPWREVDNFRARRVLPFCPSKVIDVPLVSPNRGMISGAARWQIVPASPELDPVGAGRGFFVRVPADLGGLS